MRLTLIALLLTSFEVFGQTYSDFVRRADAAAGEKDNELAAILFDSAFAKGKAIDRDLYNAACVNSLLGHKVKAIQFLRRAYEEGVDNFDWMYYDKDLNPIRDEPAYLAFEEQYRPDSAVFFFDIIRMLNVSDNVIVCGKRVFLIESILDTYSVEEIQARAGVDLKLTQDSLIDFSTKSLMFCKTRFWDDIDSFHSLQRMSLGKLTIQDCKGNLKLSNIEVKRLEFYNETRNYVRNLMFDGIVVSGTVTMSVDGYRFTCKNSTFNIEVEDDEEYRAGFTWYLGYDIIDISNTVVNNAQRDGILGVLDVSISGARRVKIEDSQFNHTLQVRGAVTDILRIRNNSFPGYVDMTGLKLPEFNCYFPFSQLSKSQFVRIDPRNFDNYAVQGDSVEEYKDDLLFDDLTGMYKRFYDSYRSRADITSANSVYVLMKDLEIAHLKAMEHRGTEESMRLRINQLMGFYTDHATSPGKALIISFYIILVFGIFYCFFPSEWDKTSKEKIISDFKLFVEKNEHGYVRPFFKMMKGLLISLLNAIALSMNAFITLGFGNIPTTGIARYMCIVQGALGWFLLSLFTVALLNQVLL